MYTQHWFPLGLTGLISLLSKGCSRVQRNSKASVLGLSTFFMVQLSHLYMTTRKSTSLTLQTFVSKVISLIFNMLSRFGITFLPKSKGLLILWLQSPSAVILEAEKIKSITVSIFFPTAMILVFFQCWVLSQLFHSPLSFSSRGSSSLLSIIRVVSSAYLGFPGGSDDKESACQCRRCKTHRFNPLVGKISWRRKRQPTPVFLSGKFHGQGNLVGYSPWSCRVGQDWVTEHIFTHWHFWDY